MESFGNERKVQQGEDWNLDITLSSDNQEYIPYIISNERNNPHFVVTVASTKYEKNLRYVKSWWNALVDIKGEKIPTFYQTVPYYIREYADIEALPENPDITLESGIKDRLLYQYTLLNEEIDDELGHRPYHYYYFDYDPTDSFATRQDEYECTLRFNFVTRETANWESQNYMYQITLVSGPTLEYTLDEIRLEKGNPADWPSIIEAQYHYVKARWPQLLESDIDFNSPLGRIDEATPILVPTKLEVLNNLRRII